MSPFRFLACLCALAALAGCMEQQAPPAATPTSQSAAAPTAEPEAEPDATAEAEPDAEPEADPETTAEPEATAEPEPEAEPQDPPGPLDPATITDFERELSYNPAGFMEGDDVREVQEELAALNYKVAGEADGRYAATTVMAVHLFEHLNGLPVDGIVDIQVWGLLNDPTVIPFPNFERELSYNPAGFMEGMEVTLVQQRLADLGYLAPEEITGSYGALTLEAVERFQAENGLEPDGIVGDQTWEALFNL